MIVLEKAGSNHATITGLAIGERGKERGEVARQGEHGSGAAPVLKGWGSSTKGGVRVRLRQERSHRGDASQAVRFFFVFFV